MGCLALHFRLGAQTVAPGEYASTQRPRRECPIATQAAALVPAQLSEATMDDGRFCQPVLARNSVAGQGALRSLPRSDSSHRETRRSHRGSWRWHRPAFLLRAAGRSAPRIRHRNERHRRCHRRIDRRQRLSRPHHADSQELQERAPAGALRRPGQRNAQRFLLRHRKHH